MNKMILKSATLLTAIATFAPVVASADTAMYNSNAGVTLKAGGTTVTPPVDPEKPVDPVNPGPGPITPGTNGPLSIDFASNFEFGTQNISQSAQTYYAHPQILVDDNSSDKGNVIGTRELYAQVTDLRGTGAGWNLSVASDSQFHLSTVDPKTTPESSAPKGDYLTGAQINFTGGKTVTAGTAASQVTSTGTISTAATTLLNAKAGASEGMGTNVFDFGTDNNGTGDYDASGILTGSAPWKLPYAPSMQTYVASKSPVTLSIPANTVQMAGRYTTTLNWTLSDTPSN